MPVHTETLKLGNLNRKLSAVHKAVFSLCHIPLTRIKISFSYIRGRDVLRAGVRV